MHGPDEPRMRGVVAERFTDLGDQIDEILLDHERIGPELFLQERLERAFGLWRTSAWSN